MEEEKLLKRVTIKLKHPNPLFEKWLLEWHEEEVSAGKSDSIYSKALGSLRKYPLVLKSGFECIILEHFDKELCLKITKKLLEHENLGKKDDYESPRSFSQELQTCNAAKKLYDDRKQSTTAFQNENKKNDSTSEPSKNLETTNKNVAPKKTKREYLPTKRSAAYGMLIGLLLRENAEDYVGFSTKAEVIAAAQPHCDVSLKKPTPGSYYTGWSSMSSLVSKGLVKKFSNPAKFCLTEEGKRLAGKLKVDEVVADNINEKSEEPVLSLESASQLFAPNKTRGKKKKVSDQNYCEKNSSSSQDFEVSPNLIQEFGEYSSSQSKDFRDAGSSQSQDFGGACSSGSQGTSGNSQSQEFGSKSSQDDFETEEMIFLPHTFDIILLVDSKETEGKQRRDEDEILNALFSRCVKFEVRGLKVGDYLWVARDNLGREMVLPFIIERKRLDDLAHSIKDGRFHEQKFRLKLCGLQNRIYLVEDYAYVKNTSFINSVKQAITNTAVCDKFTVKTTKDIFQTAKYLATQTQIITNIFQNKTLFSCKKDSLPKEIDFKDDIVSLLSFAEFSWHMEKTQELNAREHFALQLVQLSGMSSDKAWVITEQYPTPKKLIEGFISGEAEKVIADLRSGLLQNKVGLKIATTLKEFYTAGKFSG